MTLIALAGTFPGLFKTFFLTYFLVPAGTFPEVTAPYEHFGSVGNFLLFESTFLTQKSATFQSTIVWQV